MIPAFVLIDDDGHWYVCPAGREHEAEAFFEACVDYCSPENDHYYEMSAPEQPDWLDPVGGAPSRVKFTGYVIE